MYIYIYKKHFNLKQNKYLLPCVKFQGGDADFFNLIFTGTKQQVPLRSRWQRYLGNKPKVRLDGVILYSHSRLCVKDQLIWQQKRKKERKKFQVNIYLQSSGSEVYAGTGDGLSLEPHKHVCPQAVVHVVPTETERTETKT